MSGNGVDLTLCTAKYCTLKYNQLIAVPEVKTNTIYHGKYIGRNGTLTTIKTPTASYSHNANNCNDYKYSPYP